MGVVVPQEVAALGYQQLQMRKRIAMQMMAQQQRPKAAPIAAPDLAAAQMQQMQMQQQQQAEIEAQRQKMLEDAQEQRVAGV
jgi:hypothetical protein